ncbi:hemin uptake protein HemP [Methylophilus sp. OH31]|uniref:hemin uptake protein HemP n=1 Tax=Methylophilus sp. OH31 TaxID=1387312 RepID=UPI0004639EC0|nr:hemin uptake protein HemP [Methylophilus sp. OH31]
MTSRLQSSRHLQLPLGEAQNAASVSLRRMPTIEASQLLGDVGMLAIVHGGETYQLTRTKQNKLLLTKCHAMKTSVLVQQD